MFPHATETQIEYIENMYVEFDSEYFADSKIIRKETDIRISAGVSLTLIARGSVHIEPGVIVRSAGLEGKSGSNGSRGHCTTDNGRDGGRGGDGQVGHSGSSAGNFIICTTNLEFERDLERFFHVALVGGKGGAGGRGGEGGYAGRGGDGGNGGDGGTGGRGGLFWLNLVESTENKIIVEKISPPILTGGDGGAAGNGGNGCKGGDRHRPAVGCRNAGPGGSQGSRGKKGSKGDDGEFKITYSPSFSDVMKRLTDEG